MIIRAQVLARHYGPLSAAIHRAADMGGSEYVIIPAVGTISLVEIIGAPVVAVEPTAVIDEEWKNRDREDTLDALDRVIDTLKSGLDEEALNKTYLKIDSSVMPLIQRGSYGYRARTTPRKHAA